MTLGEFYTGIPRAVGHLINQAVRKFADIHHLKHEDWVHDLPLWLLISEEEPMGIKRLQVGVYRTPTDEEVRVIPERYAKDAKTSTLTVIEEIPSDFIVSTRLTYISKVEDVTGLLGRAWKLLEAPPAIEKSRTVQISLSK